MIVLTLCSLHHTRRGRQPRKRERHQNKRERATTKQREQSNERKPVQTRQGKQGSGTSRQRQRGRRGGERSRQGDQGKRQPVWHQPVDPVSRTRARRRGQSAQQGPVDDLPNRGSLKPPIKTSSFSRAEMERLRDLKYSAELTPSSPLHSSSSSFQWW